MRHTIQLATCEVDIDETTSLEDVRRAVPNFFRRGNGRREYLKEYRGFIISRETDRAASKPVRRTSVFLYALDVQTVFCVSSKYEIDSISQAERHVDRIIELGALPSTIRKRCGDGV